MVKKYNYYSINEISKKGLLFADDYFIDFELCRVNWAKKTIFYLMKHIVLRKEI